MKEKTNIYHEKQSKQLCALHTLNNLFQKNAFNKSNLDDLCLQLSPNTWVNPHRSVFGLGNYDINVIMAAVAMKYEGYEVMWWDKRRKITISDVNSCFGFILNLPSQSKVGGVLLPFKTQHWLAIRKLEDTFYNLDSKLDEPQAIGESQKLVEYLINYLAEENCELFIVNSTKPCTLAEEEDTN